MIHPSRAAAPSPTALGIIYTALPLRIRHIRSSSSSSSSSSSCSSSSSSSSSSTSSSSADLRLDEVADAALRHDRDGDGVDDVLF